MNSRLFCFASLILLPMTVATAGDTDWPQWRGTDRNGHAAPQTLLNSWPDGGPKLKWESDRAGRGYSTVAVVDGRIYTLGSDDEKCFAVCMHASDGKELWRTEVSRASTSDDYNHGWGGGPRSTPTVDGDQVFALTDVGIIAALSKSDGQLQWSVDLVAEHNGRIPSWGYSESPLVDEDRIVVTPGGSKFMIALDRMTGDPVWKSRGFKAPAQYVSIMKGIVGSTAYYVTASKPGMIAFDAQSGDQVFADSATGNGVAVVATPIIDGDRLYHTSNYGAGNTLLKLSSAEQGSVTAEPVYHLTGKTMHSHHGGVVLVDGVIYGFTKANGGAWMAQDLMSGQTLWEERIRPNRSGSICYADGHLYCYNDEDGSVYLVDASREGWNASGKLAIPQQTKLPRDKGAIWAHPIVADGMLIIRDQDLIFAYDLTP